MLKSNSFVSGEAKDYYSGGGGGELIDLFDWWNEIQESEKWQRGVYYTLSASYALVSLVALVQLIRIQLRVPEYGWTTQKVFHLMNFIVTGLRAVLFGFYRNVFTIRTKVCCFSQHIHYLFCSGLKYTIRCASGSMQESARRQLQFKLLGSFFQVSIYFLFSSSLFFCCSGIFDIWRKVGYVTCICCACFLIRCVMDALSAFDEDVDVDVLDHPVLNLFYYMMVEIVPSAIVLFILRKLPPRRVSDQYQSIR
ncbi:tobamovirus multiplication protein 1-like isoform X5 [Coffea arabica]|uniref:Tobamovirus multiplication protein 1-like isoform X5 n=1 Tax=Coffea arabica TaxID=13443 RepID=A0ABM4WVD5_COFAR